MASRVPVVRTNANASASGQEPSSSSSSSSANANANTSSSSASSASSNLLDDIQRHFSQFLHDRADADIPSVAPEFALVNGMATTTAARAVRGSPSAVVERGGTQPSSSSLWTTGDFTLDLYADPAVQQLKRDNHELQKLLSETKVTLTERLVAAEQEVDLLRARLSESTAKELKLEGDRRFLLLSEQRAKDSLRELEETHLKSTQEIEKKMALLSRDNTELKEALSVTKMEARRKESEHQSGFDILKLKFAEAEQETQKWKENLAHQQAATQKCQAELSKLQGGAMSASSETKQIIESLQVSLDRSESIRKHLAEQVESMKSLEMANKHLSRENQRLTEQNRSMELLREQNSGLQRHVDELKQSAKRYAEVELELAQLQKEKAQWTSYLTSSDLSSNGIDSPMALSRKLASSREERLLIQEQLVEMKSQLSRRETEMSERFQKMSELTAKNTELNGQLTDLRRQNQQLHQLGQLKERDIGFLKEQLNFVDKEYSTFTGQQLDQLKVERIAHLETLVGQYQAQVDSLEKSLEQKQNEVLQLSIRLEAERLEPPPISSKKRRLAEGESPLFGKEEEGGEAAKSEMEDELLRLRGENSTLAKEIKSLEGQLAALEQRFYRGEYNPATTKVLHMKVNPEALAQQQHGATLAQLQKENKELLARLEVLQEGTATEKSSASSSSSSSSSAELAASTVELVRQREEAAKLKDKMAEMELRMKRLKEVFGQKILEFREASYSLTGYKMEMQDDQYRLTSMYAEREVDYLLFRRSAHGVMEMLETEYSRSIQPMLAVFQQRPNSLPAILSSITLDLFEKQTSA